MLPRVAPLLRSSSAAAMARPISRAALLPNGFSIATPTTPSTLGSDPSFTTSLLFTKTRYFHVSPPRHDAQFMKPAVNEVCGAGRRGYRKMRRRATAKTKQKELELNVSICIEDGLPDDSEILSIAELLRLNVPMAIKLVLDGLKDSPYKTRDTTITDVGGFESIELSVMLCNDNFIRKLNKEWRDEDHATDVLSMSQHVPQLHLPVLMLGDIVVSVETAARQAEERGHTLVDEIRILLVHGLLHLFGFDHEMSEEAESEMEKEEQVLLKSLGWRGKGLIQSACDGSSKTDNDSETLDGRKKEAFGSTNRNSSISSATWMELCLTAKVKFQQQMLLR